MTAQLSNFNVQLSSGGGAAAQAPGGGTTVIVSIYGHKHSELEVLTLDNKVIVDCF